MKDATPHARAPEKRFRIGPTQSQFKRDLKPGDCPECGRQCAPECGRHPLGCIFGGADGYWLIADGCTLDHGEDQP